MRLFVDANILVSVLNKEYPLFPFTSRILSLAGEKVFQIYTSPVCLAITFYFAGKKHGILSAKQKIDILCRHISIAENTSAAVKKSLSHPAIYDFEDRLEYYAAKENQCHCIITENKDDFYFSEIEVMGSIAFCNKYMGKHL